MGMIEGVLRSIGDSESKSKVNTYSYLEIEDTTTGKLCVLDGLDGKIRTSLGKSVQIHTETVLFSGTYIYAITVDGKSYYSKYFASTWQFFYQAVFSAVATVVLSWTIIFGILIGYAFIKMIRLFSLQKQGRQLPNSVGIVIP
jgi:hypothetical protein